MKRRYIDLEDLITRLDADIEYSKLTGRLERAQNIAEIKNIIEQVGFIDIPVKETDTETVIYRHTGERIMVEWLEILDGNGDTYLINADNILYVGKDGIALRGGGRLKTQIDIEDVERVIVESRKTGERWLNG